MYKGRWRPLLRASRPGTALDLLESLRNHRCSATSVSRTLYRSEMRIVLTVCLENAVDPQNFEPNLALDLEIADLINSKKGNAYVMVPVSGGLTDLCVQSSRSCRRNRQLR